MGKRSYLERRGAGAQLAHAAGDPTIFGARDAALIALLDGAGLKDDELTRLELRDFDPSTRAVRVARAGGVVCVRLDETAGAAVARWLGFRGRAPGPLIYPLERPGRIVRKRISRGLVHDVIRRRSRAAGAPRSTPGEIAHSRETAFRCPAAGRRLARHGSAMRIALTSRLDRLAFILSGGVEDARAFDWTGITAERIRTAEVPADIGQRQVNEMLTALYGVLKEAVIGGELPAETYAEIQKQRIGAARRSP